MFDHFGFTVRDMTKSLPFYEACLAPLGITVVERQPEFDAVILAGENEFPFIWMGSHKASWMNKDAATGSLPVHFAFPASSPDAVDAFYREGLSHGGVDQGEPGDRGGRYYAAYLIDPDGNNVEAGYRR